MSIGYQFGDVDGRGATIRAQAAALEAEHQAEQANAHGQKAQTAGINTAGTGSAVGSSWA
jgi:hypothetical protein